MAVRLKPARTERADPARDVNNQIKGAGMPDGQAGAGRDKLDSLSTRVGATEARDKAAVESLQTTAKWITGGIMVSAGGIIAGSSLTSLGSLDLNDVRLWVAAGAALVGFLTLGFILMAALDVLVPRTYDLSALIDGDTMTEAQRRVVLGIVQEQLPPAAHAKM